MEVTASRVDPQTAASILRWWRDSGVDVLVDEMPEAWLNRSAKPLKRAAPADAAVTGPTLPGTLVGLTDWLATTETVPAFGSTSRRVAPFGAPGAALMIFTDMPDPEDVDTGALFSGVTGALFDNMLTAIGVSRDQVYCAPLCPGRSPTGQLDEESQTLLGTIARHHIRLAGPKIVWMLGQSTSRAVLGVDAAGTQTKLLNINQDGVIVPCVASLHPRLLLQHPKRKAKVWADMQLIVGGLSL